MFQHCSHRKPFQILEMRTHGIFKCKQASRMTKTGIVVDIEKKGIRDVERKPKAHNSALTDQRRGTRNNDACVTYTERLLELNILTGRTSARGQSDKTWTYSNRPRTLPCSRYSQALKALQRILVYASQIKCLHLPNVIALCHSATDLRRSFPDDLQAQ